MDTQNKDTPSQEPLIESPTNESSKEEELIKDPIREEETNTIINDASKEEVSFWDKYKYYIIGIVISAVLYIAYNMYSYNISLSDILNPFNKIEPKLEPFNMGNIETNLNNPKPNISSIQNVSNVPNVPNVPNVSPPSLSS